MAELRRGDGQHARPSLPGPRSFQVPLQSPPASYLGPSNKGTSMPRDRSLEPFSLHWSPALRLIVCGRLGWARSHRHRGAQPGPELLVASTALLFAVERGPGQRAGLGQGCHCDVGLRVHAYLGLLSWCQELVPEAHPCWGNRFLSPLASPGKEGPRPPLQTGVSRHPWNLKRQSNQSGPEGLHLGLLTCGFLTASDWRCAPRGPRQHRQVLGLEGPGGSVGPTSPACCASGFQLYFPCL